MGPVFLGATNRYYYPCLFTVDNDPDTEWDPEAEAPPIARIVQCLSIVIVKDGHIQVPDAPPQKFDLGQTKLEFYDYIRYVDPVDEITLKSEGPTGRACRPATSLARIQAVLDDRLPECWKGRVILKNREEAPPCTACGLNLMEQWKDVVVSEVSAPGEVIPCELCHMGEEEETSPVIIHY
jgi:hypothetical protein